MCSSKVMSGALQILTDSCVCKSQFTPFVDKGNPSPCLPLPSLAFLFILFLYSTFSHNLPSSSSIANNNMASSQKHVHVLAYPFPSSGHIIPLLDLSKRLVARGIHDTILITPSNLPLLQPLLPSHAPFLQSLLLSDPQQKKLFHLVSAMRRLHHPFLLSWAYSHPSPPVATISDFFLSWTHHLALDLRIPRLVSSPSNAFALSFFFSLWRHLPVNPDPAGKAASLITCLDLPNSLVYPVDESLTSTNS